ncbi:type II CRISPR RNA-guided endonuclease Cas9 [Holzapfeliella sp. JNUCC 80]
MNYILGLDLGITSVGYAVLALNDDGNPYKVETLNSVMFPIAENEKGESKASERGDLRRARRITRRRKFRKHRVRQLFVRYNLLKNQQVSEIFSGVDSVYDLRVRGLDNQLSYPELFVVLYYFAGHRGFKSNRKSELQSKDMGILLKSLNETEKELLESKYRTLGELYLKSPKFAKHKRNKGYEEGYIGSSYRNLVVDEIERILDNQQNLPDRFKEEYLEIFNSQRSFDEGPGVNSPYAGNQIEKMVGLDSLDRSQTRAAKATFTFQYFKLLSDLNILQYKEDVGGNYLSLNQEQRKEIVKFALTHKTVNFKQVKKQLQLPETAVFNLVRYDQSTEGKTKLSDFSDIQAIQKVLPDKYAKNYALIDQLGTILTSYKSDQARIGALNELRVDICSAYDELLKLNYSKFGKLSLKTMRAIIPYLEEGLIYNEAAEKAGYDFQNVKIDDDYIFENVTNPVVKRTVRKSIKIINQIIRKYGPPTAINIELARDLGKTKQERKKIEKNQNDNRKTNEKIASRLRELGCPVNGQTILKLKLYDEQKGIDPYDKSRKPIDLAQAIDGNSYEIDHIIPYSISFDDSYTNKVLTRSKFNQEKGNRIPMDYLSHDEDSVSHLESFARELPNNNKKMHLLKKELTAEDCKSWKNRNIQDTSYMTKLLKSYLEQNIEFAESSKKQKVHTLSGSVTSKIRSRWGITKDRDESDLHHAVDAVVIAAITPGFVKKVTQYSHDNEIKYNTKLWSKSMEANVHSAKELKLFNDFPLPWPDFREELNARISDDPQKLMSGRQWSNYSPEEIQTIKPVFVVRMPNKKLKGAIHNETIKSAKYLDSGYKMQRVSVTQLKLNEKGEIVSGKNSKYMKADDGGNLKVWNLLFDKLKQKQHLESQLSTSSKDEKKQISQKIQDIFPGNKPEYTDKGNTHNVRKVKVFEHSVSGVRLKQQAIAENAKGSMYRIDIFENDKTGYLFVPVYKSSARERMLPNTIATSGKSDRKLSAEDKFLFSVYPSDLLYINFSKPKSISYLHKGNKITQSIDEIYGYYISANISTASISIRSHDNSIKLQGIGIAGLKKISKYQVDYLGNYKKVTEKKRQRIN